MQGASKTRGLIKNSASAHAPELRKAVKIQEFAQGILGLSRYSNVNYCNCTKE